MRTFARDADRAAIFRRLGTLRPDSAPRWGAMNVRQMLRHCADACRMAHGEVTPRERPPSWSRPIVKAIALYAPLPWPRGIRTVPELDCVAAATPLGGEFADEVAALVAVLQRVRARGTGHAWPRHPIFGPMSERAWLRWAWLHMDHHLRQFGA